MGSDGNGQMGLNCPSSEIVGLGMNSGSMFKTSHEGGDCFFSPGWDPIVSISQNPNLGDSVVTAHGVFADLSDPNVVEMVPKFPDFSGGNYSGMLNSFGVPGRGQNYCPLPVETASPNGKRRRVFDPPSSSNPNKTAEVEAQQDLSGDSSEQKGSDEKKRKTEQNNGVDQFTKPSGKQVKDNSNGEDTPTNGNYVHVRARRGQATNSHSLAERVRREKISERMRALQELVPGCSKITGKAVMLDEIINYVQSLQQQIEFLSMKLATVNPELNIDINRILSKDIFHLRVGNTPLLGFNPGTSSSHPYTSGIHQRSLPAISNTSTYLSLPQGTWDGEMQGLSYTGFDSNHVNRLPRT